MNSLRARLLAWLLGAVICVGVAGGLAAYRNALAEADAFFDYHLRQTALLLRDQPVEYLLAPRIPAADAAYDFVIQVWSLDGVRVYLSRPHTVLPNVTTLGFSTVTTGDDTWRVFGVQAFTSVIQVAQPMRVRREQAAHLALQTLRPFALLLPILGLVIWLAVGGALRPVQRLTGQVKARRVNALEPLPDTGLPDEVRPLVGALNELLGRLGAALDRERAFMADAAHELRTPLTALALQLERLAAAGSEVERSTAMAELGEGVRRASRLVEQMLALARQDPSVVQPRVAVQFDEIAREAVAALVPLADARRIDLGVARAQSVKVLGDADALRTLVTNLVDNAVRYTPEGGRVDVSLERVASALDAPGLPARARLAVLDTGPGIPPEERIRVFDRFYRRPGSAGPGSGLGMAIVKAIADSHGAAVSLDSGPGGTGLLVTVNFPAL